MPDLSRRKTDLNVEAYVSNYKRSNQSPHVFRFWFERFSGFNVALGLGLLGIFLFFTVWLRLSRVVLPRDLEQLCLWGFWTVICFSLLVNLGLLLVHLGLPGLVNKKLFGGRVSKFQKILDKIYWLAKTPSMFGYHLVMHLPSPLIKILLWFFPAIPEQTMYRFHWFVLYIPWLVPPLVLNLEILLSTQLYHFYQSLVLLVIPVLSRQVLGLAWCAAQALENQKIRKKKVAIFTEFSTIQGQLNYFEVKINHRIPGDQRSFHGQHWLKAYDNIYTISRLEWTKNSYSTLRKISILRCVLYCVGWGTLLLRALGYI